MISRRRVFFACFLLLFLIFGNTLAPREASAQSAVSEVLRLVNELRVSYGLPPYTQNAYLSIAAQNHANWMASTGVYSHTGANGSTPQSRAAAAGYIGYVAENIVGGTGLTPQQGVTWWINSPSHFNTLISNRHNEVGIAYVANNVNGHDQNFYVLVAGHQDGSAAPSAQAAAGQTDELLFVAPVALSSPREDGSIVHVVGSGQSLWTIAARYEVALQDLLLFNNLTEDSVINPGDELLVRWPEGADPPPTPTPPTTYVVRRGDSAWTIAARYRISLADFLWYNNMAEDDLLEPGDTVTVRLAEGQPLPPTPTPQLTHIVRSGQTLWEIAQLHNLSIDELLALNGLTQNAVLSIGQELFIRATPMPAPTATSHPATFTPIAPGNSVALGAESLPVSAALAPTTPTPPAPNMAAGLEQASVSDSAAAVPVSNKFAGDWAADWTVGVAVAFFVLAFFLLGIAGLLVVRRLGELRD